MDFIKVIVIGLLSVTLIQCSSAKKKDSPTVATPAAAATTAPAEAPAVETKAVERADSTKELEDLKISLKKAEAIAKKDTPVTEPEHHRKVGPVAADKALSWLKNGNGRYLKGFLRKDGAAKKDVERLAAGQAPHSIVLSCSDSRVPPEVVFDQKLGEIFVVRTAGQSLDNAVIASIEYGVQHLGSNLILVMGHTSCGAVKAAMETVAGGDTGSPYINALVAEVQPRLGDRSRGPASENLATEGWENARGVTQKLLEKSKIVRDAAKSGSLRLETALYHLKSGQVEWSR